MVFKFFFIKLKSIKLKNLAHTALQSSFLETAVKNTTKN